MYPNITLEIINSTPKLIFHPDEDTNRLLTTKDENIQNTLVSIFKELELYEEIENSEMSQIEAIMHLISEGDPRTIESTPGMDKYKNEFGFDDYVMNELKRADQNRDDLSGYGEITNEIKKELIRNQNLDIVASLFDVLLNVIIAKTLLFASDLGIGYIILHDHDGMIRLREKMSSELSKMEIELEIM